MGELVPRGHFRVMNKICSPTGRTGGYQGANVVECHRQGAKVVLLLNVHYWPSEGTMDE